MIESIQLKFGRGLGAPPQVISGVPITVFVGPNNSGKSMVLSEINNICMTGAPNGGNAIVERLKFLGRGQKQAEELLSKVSLTPVPSDPYSPGDVILGKGGYRQSTRRENAVSLFQNPSQLPQEFARLFMRYSTLLLDGKSRMNLCQSQQAGDLLKPPQNNLQFLFQNDSLRGAARTAVYDAFGVHLVVDSTNIGHLRLRFSKRPPADPTEERGWDARATRFQSEAIPIESFSDGVKAFTGMIIEIMAGDPSVILIDEPEAFLHPALAFKLGKEISDAVANTEKRILASTHSPQFLMGCVQSGVPLNIVRLTYRGGVATARILESENLVKLMRDPLLRSADVMSAIFYESVVVAESDADRAFYQEVNERLLRSDPKRGIPNCLFLNAQNKQTIRRIIEPLRQLGIPAAAIVDLDVVKDGGKNWTEFLSSIGVPDELHQSFGQQRGDVNKYFETSGKCMKRGGGIAILDDGEAAAAQDLVKRLAEYGAFVVPGGELESWLVSLEITARKSDWLIRVFERMGDDPNGASYITPSEGDVWAFMDLVRSWLTAGHRRGIPA